TRAAQSFDHLVGADQQSSWHTKAECLGGLEIDEQLDFRRLLHRQLGRFVALENPASVDARLTVRVCNAASIAQQAARGDELTPLVDCGQRVTNTQCGELFDPSVEESIGADYEARHSQSRRGREYRI